MAVDERVDVVARTIYGEARGEPHFDRLAVGFVIYEREKRPGWWGAGYPGVCRAEGQFSCWSEGDPNFEKIVRAERQNPEVFNACVNVAQFIVRHATDRDLAQFWGTKDPERFPTHYVARWLGRPNWLTDAEAIPTPVDTAHVFYAGLPGTPPRRTVRA